MKVVKVETAAQMFEVVKRSFEKCDCLIMAAAVADYTPAGPAKNKIKKAGKPLTIKLKPTTDILEWAGKHKKKNQILVGFALEDKAVRSRAEKKLKDKNLDMIIANSLSAIGSDSTSVQIKTCRHKWQRLPRTGKTTIAKKIISLVENISPKN
jgi:phosphopantothenoylcysteine decarboxylase/phosphopantothenate--cysteine ligase